MSNSKELFSDLVNKITLDEPPEEIRSIVLLLLESKLGLTRTEVLAGKPLPAQPMVDWDLLISRINAHEPVQYVLEEAWFCESLFKVSNAVLIPRPETEGLIRLVLQQMPAANTPSNILDIGTGSGCLAITLAKALPDHHVWATDISAEALDIAAANALRHNAAVQFVKHNILEEEIPERDYTLIVSNPPYITLAEKQEMQVQVTDHEPWLALFVAGQDPLLFYRHLSAKSRKVLLTGGKLMVEINHQFGRQVQECFIAAGLVNVLIDKDLEGKDRYVSGLQP